MRSSILPSSRPWPTLATSLVAALAMSLAGSVLYTLKLNPEIQYFLGTDRLKRAWAHKLTREYGAKLVLYGGSSCEFSLDGERLLEKHGLPAANLGRGAGMGASILTQATLPEVRRGDTLVLALEPGLLTAPLEPPSLGVQLSFALGHPEWVVAPTLGTNALPWTTAVLALRPGGYHVFTLLGKLLLGRPLYRYQLADMRPSGFNRTAVKLPITGPAGHNGKLSADARTLLADLRAWARTNEVRLVYSLPWCYCPEEAVAAYQRLNAGYLAQVAEYLPVLRDPRLGAHSVLEHFADTGYHLNDEGSALRTDEFAEQFKAWRVWTRADLQRLAQGEASSR